MARRARVQLDRAAVDGMIERRAVSGAAQAARFLENEQKRRLRSRRLRRGTFRRSGRDAQGVYARAGIRNDRHLWFWVFEEYETGRGDGNPFLRASLFDNSAQVARLLLSDRRLGGDIGG